ncbi:hypothetical protein, partial [Aeromonas caviae]|uniref:hypothetical protein n=2 Tax=Aeromonas caviae TaxID=648 RepID=UPI001CC6F952
ERRGEVFRLNRNERSHWSGNGVHVESELVFMIGRNMQQMDTMHLTTLRSQVMAAKDLAFFERLFSTTSDKLLRAYSAHSIKQAREMAFRDTRQWELLLLDIGIKMHGRPASELWNTYYLACRETLL